MADKARSKAQQEKALAEITGDLSRRLERLQDLADRAAIGIRSALAQEVKVVAERIESLKGRAWDLRRRANLIEEEFRDFDSECREMVEVMKVLTRKIK